MNHDQQVFAQQMRFLLDKFEKGSVNRQLQELEDFVDGAQISLATIEVPQVVIYGLTPGQQVDQLVGLLGQSNWKANCHAWLRGMSLVKPALAPRAAVSLLLAALYNL